MAAQDIMTQDEFEEQRDEQTIVGTHDIDVKRQHRREYLDLLERCQGDADAASSLYAATKHWDLRAVSTRRLFYDIVFEINKATDGDSHIRLEDAQHAVYDAFDKHAQ